MTFTTVRIGVKGRGREDTRPTQVAAYDPPPQPPPGEISSYSQQVNDKVYSGRDYFRGKRDGRRGGDGSTGGGDACEVGGSGEPAYPLYDITSSGLTQAEQWHFVPPNYNRLHDTRAIGGKVSAWGVSQALRKSCLHGTLATPAPNRVPGRQPLRMGGGKFRCCRPCHQIGAETS